MTGSIVEKGKQQQYSTRHTLSIFKGKSQRDYTY